MACVCDGCRNYKKLRCTIGSPRLARDSKKHEWYCPMKNAVLVKMGHDKEIDPAQTTLEGF